MRSIIVISMLVVALAHYGASARPNRRLLKFVKANFPDTKEKMVDSGIWWDICEVLDPARPSTCGRHILNILYQPGEFDEDYRKTLIDDIVNNEKIFDKIAARLLDGKQEILAGLKGDKIKLIKAALRKTLKGLGKDKPATPE